MIGEGNVGDAMDRSTYRFAMQTPAAPPLPAGPAPLPFPQGPPPPQPLWQSQQLRHHLTSLFQKLSLLKAVTKELEALISFKEAGGTAPKGSKIDPFYLSDVQQSLATKAGVKGVNDSELESLAREAARGLRNSMEILLAPLQAVTNGNARWEEMAAAARLADKRLKIRRNRKWRQRKRHKAAELHRKKQEHFERADFEADNWRARELAKDIAKRQMEKMKEVAERKAKEERLRLEEELEQVLLVEKLQELRALRIQKLKKQGRFFPEEDNQFMERVQAAVEEEERQAAAAADTSAAALAIASAEEASRTAKTVMSENVEDHGLKSQDLSLLKKYKSDQKEALPSSQKTLNPNAAQDHIPKAHLTKGAPLPDSFCGLPAEYYHYYYGSSTDIGTLIEDSAASVCERNWSTWALIHTRRRNRLSVSQLERLVFCSTNARLARRLPTITSALQVRRNWDTFIMQGGSRIPGHWIQAPVPSDSTWASFLVKDSRNKENAACKNVVQLASGFHKNKKHKASD